MERNFQLCNMNIFQGSFDWNIPLQRSCFTYQQLSLKLDKIHLKLMEGSSNFFAGVWKPFHFKWFKIHLNCRSKRKNLLLSKTFNTSFLLRELEFQVPIKLGQFCKVRTVDVLCAIIVGCSYQFLNKPKMAYSRDLAVHGLSWMTFMDDCHGRLSWMTVMDDFHGWLSWMTLMDDWHGSHSCMTVMDD